MLRYIAACVLMPSLLVTAASTTASVCTSKQLNVFQEVSSHVQRCKAASSIAFEMPPRVELSPLQRTKFCSSKSCVDMIGAVDDLEIPKCATLFENQNVTLQTSLDRFVSACDVPSPAPSKQSKKSKSSLDSGSGSGASSKRNKKTMAPEATSAAVGATQSIVAVILVSSLVSSLLVC